MFACYWGFVGGGMLFFSQYWGAKDDDGINRAYGVTLLLHDDGRPRCFCGLATLAPQLVMRVYTDKTAIQEIGVRYLRVVGFAYPLQMLLNGHVRASALDGAGQNPDVRRALFPSRRTLFSTGCSFTASLGLPALGIQGAAVATVMAASGERTGHMRRFRAARSMRIFSASASISAGRANSCGEYFRKCFFILCNELMIGVGNMVINIVLGRQSEQAIAATAVFRTLEGFIIGFFAGFSNASSVLVGKEIGAGNLDEAYERAKRLILMCASAILLACLFLIAVHEPLLHVMSLQGESYRIGVGMLLIYCVAAVIRMSNWTHNDTFRASGDATYGTVLEICFMYAMVLPAVCLTGLKLHAPFLVIFACCYIDEPVRLVLMLRHLYTGRWVRPVTPQGQAALAEFREKRGLR